MVSGGLREQIEAALLTENQFVQSDKTQVLSKMIRAILMCLLASALAPDLTRLLEELSQREQGK